MKRIVYLVLFFGSLLISSNFKVDSLAFGNQIKFLNGDYAYEGLNEAEKVLNFDNHFVGTIKNIHSVSQFNGKGTPVPYTYFNVTVNKVIKGNVDDEVVIKFYGGINEENDLILLDDLSYPIIGEKYSFYSNKSNILFSEDQRTITNSFVVSNKTNMVLEKKQLPKKLSIIKNDLINNYIDILRISDPGGDLPEPSNEGTSFGNAIPKGINTVSNPYFMGYSEIYYVIRRSYIDYVSVFSLGNLDLKIELYDANRNIIASNDNVAQFTRGYALTQNPNFFLSFYMDKDTTYYLKISETKGLNGSSTIKLMVDNYCFDINDLIFDDERHDVDSGMKVHYTDKTNYGSSIVEAINYWNKLGVVTFEKDGLFTTNDVTLKEINDKDSNYFALHSYKKGGSTINFNNYYMNVFNYKEKLKTIVHEFGHCLGLDDFSQIEGSENVMLQGRREFEKFGSSDLAAYRKKWGY